jgi:predicted transcriptional regulator
MTITFEELRKIKDSLPDGSMHRIAEELGVSVETVRNYFGGADFQKGEAVGIHFEQGPGGGVVKLDDSRVVERALEILDEKDTPETEAFLKTSTLTFEQLRRIKDSLPDGSMSRIAEELGLDEETVRNHFGGANFRKGETVGIHFELGPGGGIVKLDDTRVIEKAQAIIAEHSKH